MFECPLHFVGASSSHSFSLDPFRLCIMAFDNAEAVETDAIAFWKETRCADIGNSPDNIALPTDVRNLTFFKK